MNISQINKFAFWLDNHELSTKAIAMYHALLSCLNANCWNQPVKVSNTKLMHRTGIKHKTTLFEARNELIKNNLISYSAKVGRNEPEYLLLELEDMSGNYDLNGTKNVPFSKSENGTENVPLDANKKINGTENVPLNSTENVPFNDLNGTEILPFTQSIPIYKKNIKNNKNNAANIDNTKLVSIATAEETATSSNPVEFNPILTLEKILGVTCSGCLAEKYIALYEDVGQEHYVRALEKAVKAKTKNFKYIKNTAEGLNAGIDFDDIYKKGQPQGKKVTIDDINAWADGKGYMDKEGGFYK